MRNRVVRALAALAIGLVVCGPGRAQQITNLIQNGGFETGAMSPWSSYANAPSVRTQAVVKDCVGADVPEGPIEGAYCLNVKVTTLGANDYAIGLGPRPQHDYEQGKKYTFSVFLKCKTGTLQVRLKPELATGAYTGYGSKVVTITDKWAEYYTTTPVFADKVTPGQISMHIGFAVAEFWVDDAKLYEGDYVPTPVKNQVAAASPTPDSKAVDVRRDPVLSWKAGPFAATHNVYLGTSFDDVNAADVSQAVSRGQPGTTFQPAEPLEYGQTYYWRVDEVNAPPDSTVFTGDVWSFTVEPYTYPITGVTATASSQDKSTTGPANTVNGSGLTNDLHSTANDAMWLSGMTDPGPVWIRYQFDKAYKLSELWVWNHNTEFEPVLGYGLKDVTIETSTDGTNWTALKEVQFAQAPALAGYAHNTTVDLGGVMARYVRLTANSNWSAVGLKQYGLSEVRFFYIPVEAYSPDPAQYAENVAVDATLDWRPGREATSHQITYGTSKAAVADGSATSKTVTKHGFAGGFDFGTTYYWKVDEIGAATYPGSIWSFTTQQFTPVDDFEGYTDQEGNEIFTAWVDGFTDGLSNSVVGYFTASRGTFGETSITHGGRQSMPFEYNDVRAPYYSEATRTFATAQDWTVNGANSLALWYVGRTQPANTAAPLYVTVEDRTGKKATVVNPDPAAVTKTIWTQWQVAFSGLTGVNLAAVKKLTIGVGDKASPKPGGAGMLYIDDIEFGKPILPVGLVASYSFENNVDDSSGNGHNGTILGTPSYVDGPAGKGKAMLFPGTSGNAVDLGTFNPSEKTGMLSVSLWAKWNGLSSYWQGLIGKRNNWNTTDTMWQIEANQTAGTLSFSCNGSYPGSGNPVLKVGEWTHLAVTFDKTTARFYVNGTQTGSGAFSFGPARDASLLIGCDNAGGGNPFNGALDEVKLYDIVLTPAEVLALAGK